MIGLLEIIMLIFSFILFAWAVYNFPAILIGINQIRRKNADEELWEDYTVENLPFFSLIVPMKNEEKVAGRILRSLMKIDYPSDRYEVIVVEDCSVDETWNVCKQFETKYPKRIRCFHRNFSKGKPSALNYGLKFARGEIIGVFDADNLVKPDVLRRTAKYFENQEVAAVQGLLSSINPEENMVTKLIHYETVLQYHALLSGKDKLGLFVHFSGTCLFIRRKVLVEVGGWRDEELSEDLELSARLAEKGHFVKFASDIQSWIEVPSSFGQLLKQRVRWFRGCMEVALKYGKLLKRLNKRCLDAEMFFSGPFLMLMVLATYILSLFNVFASIRLGTYTSGLLEFTSFVTLFGLFVLGIGLIYASKPRKINNLMWLPLVYFYWAFLVFVAFYAFLLIVFRRPKRWVRTPRTGVVKNHQLMESLRQWEVKNP